MKQIYYVPSNENIDDYKSSWFRVASEVHNSLSENIEPYLLEESDKAQFVTIPEFTICKGPQRAAAGQKIYFCIQDDFYYYETENVYSIEVWSYDLEDKQEPKLLETYDCNYVDYYQEHRTDQIQFEIGWYKIIYKKNNEPLEDSNLTVFEDHDDHEIFVFESSM
jgi:hypothetical protein